MGSRYDLVVFQDVTLNEFVQALVGQLAVGDAVDGPWKADSAITIAQYESRGTPYLVIASPPMKTPSQVDTLLATKLEATESLFATVWDTVSTYSLSVTGPGVDRYLSAEPLGDEEADVPEVYQEGQRLDHEPPWLELDESYIQAVMSGRYGIDPGDMRGDGWHWYALAPWLVTDSSNTQRFQDGATAVVAVSSEQVPSGWWSRIMRLFGRQ